MKLCKQTLAVCVALCTAALLAGGKPKYVFVFIGDGMSTPQRMVAEDFAAKIGYGELAMNRLPYHATTRTRSANSIITDSAAAATAIACGVKTGNAMLGVTPDGAPVDSAAEVAKRRGWKVGIITTTTIMHATPAAFYSHRKNRGEVYRIGLDLVNSGFDYFAGGTVQGQHLYVGGAGRIYGRHQRCRVGGASARVEMPLHVRLQAPQLLNRPGSIVSAAVRAYGEVP